MKYSLLSFLFFVLSFTMYAQQEIDRLVLNGLQNCYDFKWEKAEDDFQKIIDKYPNDPRGYHYRSTIHIWSYLSNKSQKDFDSFIAFSNIALEKGESYLETKNNDEIILYTIGTAYTCRAIVYAKAEKYLDAAWASKKSESFLLQAIALNPKRTDAYLGLGLYNFAISQIPSAFKWALNLAGIKGNRALGLKYVKKAAKEGQFSKTEAQFYLSQILSEVIYDLNGAFEYLKLLTKKYPDNLLFNYSMAVVEIKRRNLNSAEKYLNYVLNEKTPLTQLIAYSEFLKGDIHFKKNEFEESKAHYERFIQKSNDNDYKGTAYYRLGIAFELTGDRQSAENYFPLSGSGNMDLDDDVFSKRRGEIYSKRTMAVTEGEVLKASNMIEQGNEAEAIDTLLMLVEEIKSEKLKAEAYFYICQASYYLKKYSDAIKYGGMAKEFNSADERWIKPFTDYYIARSYKAAGNIEKAKKHLDDLEDSSDHDYQSKLRNLVFAFRLESKELN